jgi:putative ABC transport system ATP-binding protein
MTSPFVSHPIVKLEGIGKSFGQGLEVVHPIRDVSMSLSPGEVVGLVGRSGSGKTTLLNILLGWEEPDRGSMHWDGRGPSETTILPWNLVGVLPQTPALIDELSVLDNVRLPQTLGPSASPADHHRLEDIMAQLEIAHLAHRRPSQTSLGEQQRTALARAIVLRPRLLLADEPTSHQDAGRTAVAFDLLRELALEGGCCLVATHSDHAAGACDRILRLEGGLLRAPSDAEARKGR